MVVTTILQVPSVHEALQKKSRKYVLPAGVPLLEIQLLWEIRSAFSLLTFRKVP